MAWTQSDLDSLELAMKKGVLSVRFGDRMVQYNSLAEMLKLRGAMKEEIADSAGTSGSSVSFAKFSKS